LKNVFELVEPLFVALERTPKCNFADIPQSVSFMDSDVVLYSIPVDNKDLVTISINDSSVLSYLTLVRCAKGRVDLYLMPNTSKKWKDMV
jgi:hypothetical protein